MNKREKRIYKRVYKRYNKGGRDRLADSLLYAERTYHDEGEYWKDYGFILPEDVVASDWNAYLNLTDEEIDEWISENMFVRIYSDYDCTGRPFTVSVSWHRNPCGLISYVHWMATDI